MTHLGHEDQFPRPSLSGRCRLGEATFAAMGRKEEDAPIADFPALARAIQVGRIFGLA
jgi:hypothetical protein